MTSTTSADDAAATRPVPTVVVALAGWAAGHAAALHPGLAGRPVGAPAAWHLEPADTLPAASHVDIAVGDGATDAAALRRRWPDATVVALVPERDDGTGTVAALSAGAHVCVRGVDPSLIAAYVVSAARRRTLSADGVAR